MDDKALKKIIAKSEYEDGKVFLKDLEKKQARIRPDYSKWLVAASVAIFIALGTFYVIQNNASASIDNLYAEYFSPYPNNYKPVLRGKSDETTLAFTAYENKNFENASILFSKLLEEKEDYNVRFYYAISLLSSGNTDLSIKQFEQLENVNFRYHKQVLWYKALALLNIGKNEKAKKVLKDLKKHYKDYKPKKIDEILSQLI